jgi:hypothetical protein
VTERQKERNPSEPLLTMAMSAAICDVFGQNVQWLEEDFFTPDSPFDLLLGSTIPAPDTMGPTTQETEKVKSLHGHCTRVSRVLETYEV